MCNRTILRNPIHFSARSLNSVMKPPLVEWLQQIVQSVGFKRANRVLIEGGGENDDGHLLRESSFSTWNPSIPGIWMSK